MAELDGVWRVRRTGGALPPLADVRKEIEGKQGVTRLGRLPGVHFDVDGLRLRYRGLFSGFVDELEPERESYRGRATFRLREFGRFVMHRWVTVVTGASSGIGRATALEFARQGASVVAVARREEALHELASECRRLGGQALVVPADVTDEEAVQDVARAAVDRFGRIDMWINNAAVTLFARVEEAPPDLFRRVIETNLFGYVHGARAAIPIFREQGRGVLVNVSSVFGAIGAPYLSAYVMSKWANRALAECLRQELVDAPDIHVCTVLPASTDTPLFQHAANYTGRAIVPLRPVYPPERVARTIVRLAERPRREVTIGLAGRGALLARILVPGLTERVAARVVDRSHFEPRPAEPTAGNLYEPIAELAFVDGGWRRPGRRRLVLAGAAAALTGLIAWTWPRD